MEMKMEDRSKINDELLNEWPKTLEEEALRRLKLPKNQGKTAKEVLLEPAMERLEKAEEKPKEEPVSEDAISGEELITLVEEDRKSYTPEELQKEAEMIEAFSECADADAVKIAFWNFLIRKRSTRIRWPICWKSFFELNNRNKGGKL